MELTLKRIIKRHRMTTTTSSKCIDVKKKVIPVLVTLFRIYETETEIYLHVIF